MPRRNLIWILATVTFCVLTWAMVQSSGMPPRGPLQVARLLPGYEQDYENLSLFLDILQYVERNYVRPLDAKARRKFFEDAIQGGLQGLDEHSSFINEKELRIFQRQNEGEYTGIGIQITVHRETKRLVVVTPIVGTPAYHAGIKPDDEILKIDGASTEGMSAEDAVERIQGPPGTQVTLTIRHRGEPMERDIRLTRSRIEVETVLGDRRRADGQWDFLLDKDAGIGYVRVVQFSRRTAEELEAVLQRLSNSGLRALIVDLRDNPGGLLDVAVKIADLFLEHGTIVTVQGRAEESQRVFEAHQPGTYLTPAQRYPMAVLINRSSASASEIVAAALQDHKRAVILGERSFGKGSVQNLISLERGKSALKLTVARYLRPSGKNIHRFADSRDDDDWGVRPDIEMRLADREWRDYWEARRERDIIRDESQVLLEGMASLNLTLAPITQPAMPLVLGGSQVLLTQFWTGAALMPRDYRGQPRLVPRVFRDKVLERAMQELYEKLKAG
ncbi:MAG: S41 family peptidase [Gemmataceae bacterium]